MALAAANIRVLDKVFLALEYWGYGTQARLKIIKTGADKFCLLFLVKYCDKIDDTSHQSYLY